MYKLLNMADFCSNEELEKEMQQFSKKYGFDGFELIKFTKGIYKGLSYEIFSFLDGIIFRRFYFFV